MSLRTPLSNAKGLGSAKEGAHHWWVQRLTSIALVPLTVMLVFCIAGLTDYSYGTVLTWMQSPWVAVGLSLLMVAMFYHIQLGIQVILEDYVHGWLKVASLIALNFACIVLVFMGLFSIIKVSL